MKNSCVKGKNGERDACDYLARLGFTGARRSVQYNGRGGPSDIVCDALPHLHIEVKRVEGMDLGTKMLADAIERAKSDCGNKFPVVLWRGNRQCWRLSWWNAAFGIVTVCGDDYDMASSLHFHENEQAQLNA